MHAVDYITVRRVPRFLDGAPLLDWISAMKRVEALDFDVIVPGHGNVGNKADVTEQREYFEALVAGVRAGIAAGKTVQELQASNMLERYSWWEDYQTGRNTNIVSAIVPAFARAAALSARSGRRSVGAPEKLVRVSSGDGFRNAGETADHAVEVEGASSLEANLRLILKDLELEGRVRIEKE